MRIDSATRRTPHHLRLAQLAERQLFSVGHHPQNIAHQACSTTRRSLEHFGPNNTNLTTPKSLLLPIVVCSFLEVNFTTSGKHNSLAFKHLFRYCMCSGNKCVFAVLKCHLLASNIYVPSLCFPSSASPASVDVAANLMHNEQPRLSSVLHSHVDVNPLAVWRVHSLSGQHPYSCAQMSCKSAILLGETADKKKPHFSEPTHFHSKTCQEIH